MTLIPNFHYELRSVLHKTPFSKTPYKHNIRSSPFIKTFSNLSIKRKVKVSSHWHVNTSHPLHLSASCITSTFLLLSMFGKEQMWLCCRRPSQEHFFLLRKCNSVWLFRAVYSSQDSRCVWMVQNTFCHFHRLCSTITSLSLQMNCWSYSCTCLLYNLCQRIEREISNIRGTEWKWREPLSLLNVGVCVSENCWKRSAISASNLMQKSRTMPAVEKPDGRDHFRASEEVSSTIHSRQDVTRPQKAAGSQITQTHIPIKAA